MAKMARLTCVWCEAYGESGRMAVASGPEEVGRTPATGALRSPLVRRRRISRRSLGSAKSEVVKSTRSAGVPALLPFFQPSRMVANVGGASGSMISSLPRHPPSADPRLPNCSHSHSSAWFVRHHLGSLSGFFLFRKTVSVIGSPLAKARCKGGRVLSASPSCSSFSLSRVTATKRCSAASYVSICRQKSPPDETYQNTLGKLSTIVTLGLSLGARQQIDLDATFTAENADFVYDGRIEY